MFMRKFHLENKLSSDSFCFVFFFRTDTTVELELVRKAALANGAFDAVIASHWSDGGAGAAQLADALIKACESPKSNFHFLYDLEQTIEEKISIIAREMYGAGSIEFQPKVKEIIRAYTEKVIIIIEI